MGFALRALLAAHPALRLKEAGKATEVIVVSVGPEKSAETLRTGLAMGADRGILVRTDAPRIEPLAVAKIISAVVAKPDWWRAAEGLIPTIPAGSTTVVIALIGTCLSANAAFFTSYGTQERKRTETDYRDVTIVDTIPGITAPGIMTTLVILVAAKVFNGPLGAENMVSTIAGLAKVFEPVAGTVGTWIFALGYFAAAFSAMTARGSARAKASSAVEAENTAVTFSEFR